MVGEVFLGLGGISLDLVLVFIVYVCFLIVCRVCFEVNKVELRLFGCFFVFGDVILGVLVFLCVREWVEMIVWRLVRKSIGDWDG